MHFEFLHGLLSSPKSSKISYLSNRVQQNEKIAVEGTHAFDLYPTKNDFESLSLKNLILDVANFIEPKRKVILYGSSHGGLVASWLAGLNPELVDGLILLAPAIYYYDLLEHRYDFKAWRRRGYINLKHPRFGKVKFPYSYARSLKQYRDPTWNLKIPTLLIHGEMDKSVPVGSSYQFIEQQNTDKITSYFPAIGNHRLSNVIDEVGDRVIDWLVKNF